MLKHRIVPTILYNSKLMVEKPRNFQRPGRNICPLKQTVLNMNNRMVDELILIDIDATKEDRTPYFDKLEEFTKELYCPVTLGGGVATLQDINKLLKIGADKVCIKSALKDKDFIKAAAQTFGSQALVASVDVSRKYIPRGGRDRDIVVHYLEYDDTPLNDYLQELEELGIGEILLTSVERDGNRRGYDCEMIKQASRSIRLPLIANGGCGSYTDMYNALLHGADAIAIGSLFLFSEITPASCALYLNNKGFNCRIEA